MCKDIEMEIVRLVREIADEEKKIKTAQSWELPEKEQQHITNINRKYELLKILKEQA